MIYILEDDKSIRELLEYSLTNSGFDVRGFELPSQFWPAVDEEKPDLVLLDIMLPEEDGMHILGCLRSSSYTSSVPVIMLTARSAEYDKIMGLDGGADDYVTKPFNIMELVSRIKAVLRRTSAGPETEFRSGDLLLNKTRHVVTVDGKQVDLTYKEFELLALLMENKGIVLERDHILSAVWGYDYGGETRTIDVHIRNLRHKLGNYGKLIKTVRGVGYKLEDDDSE